MRPAAPALLFASLAPACAYYSQADGERMQDEVYALQQQVTVLQEKLQQLQTEQSRTTSRLDAIGGELSEKTQEGRRYDADVGVQLEEMRVELAHLKGDLGALEARTRDVEEKAETTREEVELRFSAEAKAAQEAESRRQQLLGKPGAALEQAEAMIAAGEPAEARALVRGVEIENRDSKRWGVYAAKAQYLIGETYFAEENWRQAVAAFNKVRQDHRGNDTWMPGSLLRLGMCLEKLGLEDDAKTFYQRASKRFPRHPAGREARRLLRKLGS